jgi:YhcH/YjgK/YiaL family protein
MILDTLENSPLYEGLHPSFPKAFAWLRSFDATLADGQYEIDGSGLVAIVQRYETLPADSKKWEAHRIHGDIQYLASGEESIGYASREELVVKDPYLSEKDVEIYESPSSPSSPASILRLSPGSFAVFLPQDAHQPGVMVDQPGAVIKVVVKFRLQ